MSRTMVVVDEDTRAIGAKLRTPPEQVTWLNTQIDRCDTAIAQAAETLKHVPPDQRPQILTTIHNENQRLKRLLAIRDSWSFTPPRR